MRTVSDWTGNMPSAKYSRRVHRERLAVSGQSERSGRIGADRRGTALSHTVLLLRVPLILG